MPHDPSSQHCCHVCGASLGEFAPWEGDGLNPTYAICDCCGVEFGYEDCQQFGVLRLRDSWLEGGAVWINPKAMPLAWSLDEQLKNIPPDLPAGIKRA